MLRFIGGDRICDLSKESGGFSHFVWRFSMICTGGIIVEIGGGSRMFSWIRGMFGGMLLWDKDDAVFFDKWLAVDEFRQDSCHRCRFRRGRC